MPILDTQQMQSLQLLAINTIRMLAVDAVQKANSGHPGLPMGAAPMAYTLWQRHLRHNPKNPHWADRDRFVLSAGHGSMLIYALLYMAGYDVSLDDLKNFRQWGSKTPGHPEVHVTPGVETTTGPLGQGVSNAVGFALAEAYLASYFNRPDHTIVDHYTYALVGDGDLMEGVSAEACALAGHWGLGKLIVLYDDNRITLDGPADMTFSEDVLERFKANGWHTLRVEDGNDTHEIHNAILAAKSAGDKPTLIAVRTIIGYGSPTYQGTSEVHGKPLGADEVKKVREFFGWPEEQFHVPPSALEHMREAVEKGTQAEAKWDEKFAAYKAAYPQLAAEFEAAQQGTLPSGWDSEIPVFGTDKKIATRDASGQVLNAIAKHIPTMIGGDADLAGSTKTLIKGQPNTGKDKPAARNVRFGVREHGMGAIVNGLGLHGGIIKPYSATFLTFSDYMRGAVRLSALSHIPVIHVYTHDSIGLGEDGPTHQSVEHVMSLRLIPELYVFRPADANETAAAWRTAMTMDKAVAMVFSRQNLPVLPASDAISEGVAHGGYIVADCDGTPQVILMGTGSEVSIAHDAYRQLMAEGVKARLVSLPCWELFEAQDAAYRESVLPARVTARVSIEAGVTLGWQKYVGASGVAIGVDRFGASAPYERIYEEYGLTAAKVVEAAKQQIKGK
ncbi:MAG: transketolase [Anaerolineae bacterium]